MLCVSYEEIEPDQVGHLFVKVAKNGQNISEFPIYAFKNVKSSSQNGKYIGWNEI